MEPTRTYDRQQAFNVLKNSAFRGGKVNRLLVGFQKNPNALSMEGNKITLSIPGKNEIVVDLAVQDKNKKLSISRFFNYSIRGKNYKQDYNAKIDKILDQLYPATVSGSSLAKISPNHEAVDNYKQGMKLIKGDLVPLSNYKEAVKFFELAAQENHPDALFMLGNLYLKGKGVNGNNEKAIEYYERASERGHGQATLKLAGIYSIYKKDDIKAEEYLKLAKQQGEDVRNGFFL